MKKKQNLIDISNFNNDELNEDEIEYYRNLKKKKLEKKKKKIKKKNDNNPSNKNIKKRLKNN